MRFLLDENELPAILEPLQYIYKDHHFEWAPREFGSGTLDIPLFERMRERGYDALITRDRNQLANPAERRALAYNRIHWIGHRTPSESGVRLLSSLTATYVAAFPHILGALNNESESVTLHIKNLPQSPSQWVQKRYLQF